MKAIDRLYQYLDKKGLKPTAVEKEIGLSNGYLSAQKKRSADIGEGVILKIIDYFRDIDIVWLLTGQGNITKQYDCSPNVAKEDPVSYNKEHENSIYEKLYNKEREENRKLTEEIGALKEAIRQMENNTNKSDDESAVISFTQESLECYTSKLKDPVKPPSPKRSSGVKTL